MVVAVAVDNYAHLIAQLPDGLFQLGELCLAALFRYVHLSCLSFWDTLKLPHDKFCERNEVSRTKLYTNLKKKWDFSNT